MERQHVIFHVFVGSLFLFIISYIFYKNIFVSLCSMPLAYFYLRYKKKQLNKKKNQQIVVQFNQFLYSLSAALVAGKSVENAFFELESDLSLLYPADTTFIIKEIRQINKRLRNGDSIEKAIIDFSNQTSNQDIKNFAIVFSTCKRTGGDLVEVIKKTATILNTKIETQQEVEILIASKKFEAQLLSLAPLVIIGLITFTVLDYMQPLYETLIGRIVMSISLILLFISNLLSKFIMDIKV